MKQKLMYYNDIQTINYEEKDLLGRGSYGTVVYKGKFGDRDVAVKIVHSNIMDRDQGVHEIMTLKACDVHENIVRYFGSKHRRNFILIALELCDVSLKHWVENGNKSGEFSPLEILRQVTVGLEWLHKQYIVHRDLKPENILLKEDVQRVKISDFGLSRKIVDGKSCVSSSVLGGTQGWVAPEILAQVLHGNPHQCKFTFASDIFSLGCVYYFVLTNGKHAFGDLFRSQVNIMDGNILINHKDVVHGCVQNTLFIRMMISNEPSSRPACVDLLSCRVFWPPSRRAKFIEHIKACDGDLLNDILKSQRDGFCSIEHDDELEILKSMDTTVVKDAGCLIPEIYLQCKNLNESLKQYHSTRRAFNIEEVRAGIPREVIKPNAHPKSRVNKNTTTTTTTPAASESVAGSAVQNSAALSIRSSNFDGVQHTSKSDMAKLIADIEQMSLENRTAKLFEIIKTEESCTLIFGVLESVSNFMRIVGIWDRKQKSLLHTAVEYQKHSVVEYLMKRYGFSELLSTPMFKDDLVHRCIKNIHLVDADTFNEKCRILGLLFTRNPDLIDSKLEDGCTPLHVATERHFSNNKRLDFIQFLLRNNADPNAKDARGFTPLHTILTHKPSLPNVIKIVKLLIDHGADTDLKILPIMHTAAVFLSPELYHDLALFLVSIGKEKSFNIVGENQTTALHIAALISDTELSHETLDLFKSHGVNFNAVDKDGVSVIAMAVQRGRSNMFLNSLIECGADWSLLNKNKDTMLHHAALYLNLSPLKLFIEKGCNVNCKNDNGDTPLHVAFKEAVIKHLENSHEIVTVLLHNGANLGDKNSEGEMPLDLARKMFHSGKLEQRTLILLETVVQQ